MVGESLREDVWKTIAPVLHGIQRTSSEIILLELDSLRNFREACLSHLKPSLCGFRKSRCFEQAARKLLNLPPLSYSSSPAQKSSVRKETEIDNALVNSTDSRTREGGGLTSIRGKDDNPWREMMTASETLQHGLCLNESAGIAAYDKGVDYRPLPLGRRMLIYKPMPWTLRRPEKGNAVELSRKTGKKDHHKPKKGNIVGKEVWATLRVGKNQVGRHGSCEIVLHTDQRCSRVHGTVLRRVDKSTLREQ